MKPSKTPPFDKLTTEQNIEYIGWRVVIGLVIIAFMEWIVWALLLPPLPGLCEVLFCLSFLVGVLILAVVKISTAKTPNENDPK